MIIVNAEELRSLMNREEYSPIQLEYSINEIEKNLKSAAINGKNSFTFFFTKRNELLFKIIEELSKGNYKLYMNFNTEHCCEITVEW